MGFLIYYFYHFDLILEVQDFFRNVNISLFFYVAAWFNLIGHLIISKIEPLKKIASPFFTSTITIHVSE